MPPPQSWGFNDRLIRTCQKGMMKIIALFLALAACAAQPAPQMWGAKRHDVTRDGRQYALFQKGNQVEIIRLGWAAHGEHQAIRATMIEIIQQVTACRLVERTLQGDSGEMRARVACPRK
ncbi:hypothetical protein [Pseudorhodobacter sp.]|uniref:hypothetical protein n=2 Tax=Pseudorhodobacter sp. TaxID=1934400 RepID=UPI0039E5B6E4